MVSINVLFKALEYRKKEDSFESPRNAQLHWEGYVTCLAQFGFITPDEYFTLYHANCTTIEQMIEDLRVKS